MTVIYNKFRSYAKGGSSLPFDRLRIPAAWFFIFFVGCFHPPGEKQPTRVKICAIAYTGNRNDRDAKLISRN